jgi:hypothetical protein
MSSGPTAGAATEMSEANWFMAHSAMLFNPCDALQFIRQAIRLNSNLSRENRDLLGAIFKTIATPLRNGIQLID